MQTRAAPRPAPVKWFSLSKTVTFAKKPARELLTSLKSCAETHHTLTAHQQRTVRPPACLLPGFIDQRAHFPGAIRAGTSGPVNQWWRTTLRNRMPE